MGGFLLFEQAAQQGEGDGFALADGIIGEVVEHGNQAVEVLPPMV